MDMSQSIYDPIWTYDVLFSLKIYVYLTHEQ